MRIFIPLTDRNVTGAANCIHENYRRARQLDPKGRKSGYEVGSKSQ